MQPRQQALLWDIAAACEDLQRLTANISDSQYFASRDLNHLVERKLEIVGEALRRLLRDNSEMAEKLSSGVRLIALRNVIAHQYENLDHTIILRTCRVAIPRLAEEVTSLMEDE